MISDFHLRLLIRQQKIDARKSIAKHKKTIDKVASIDIIDDERDFLNYDFSQIRNEDDLIKVIHETRHFSTSNTDYDKCRLCKQALYDMGLSDGEEDMKPRFGNLIAILEQEVAEEYDKLERSRLPTQNDLTRWALKKVVLEFYRNMGLPENTVVVDTAFDDRLTTQLAPDFDVIARAWLEKLDELQRRNDKYALDPEEHSKAEDDLVDGMRGSAFEKQLDRYREEFMQKLKR